MLTKVIILREMESRHFEIQKKVYLQTVKELSMEKLKKGNCWTACFDKKTGMYLGYLVYTSREGQERYLYEIRKEVYESLGSFDHDSDNDSLIRSECKLLNYFGDTIHGVSGSTDNESIWDEAYDSIVDEMEAQAEAGDTDALVQWLDLNQYGSSDDRQRNKKRRLLMKAAEEGIFSEQKKLAKAYFYGDDN